MKDIFGFEYCEFVLFMFFSLYLYNDEIVMMKNI